MPAIRTGLDATAPADRIGPVINGDLTQLHRKRIQSQPQIGPDIGKLQRRLEPFTFIKMGVGNHKLAEICLGPAIFGVTKVGLASCGQSKLT